MRSSGLPLVVAAFLAAVFASSSIAQEPSGPATLENLVTPDGAPKPPATPEAKAAGEGAVRPAGTLVRPKDGVQHPALDKAWAAYDAAVTKAAEEIKAAIAKQFDNATAKGDLDAAEKWQKAEEKFKKAGELPSPSETKAAVTAAMTECKQAKDELAKAYETAMKSLTMEKKIDEAKAIRGEWQTVDRKPDVQSVLCTNIWQHRAFAERYVFTPDGKYVLRGTPRWGRYEISPDQKTVVLHWNNEGGFKEVISVGGTPENWTMGGGPFRPRP